MPADIYSSAPITAAQYAQYASPWLFSGSSSGAGSTVAGSPTVSAVNYVGSVNQGVTNVPTRPQDVSTPIMDSSGNVVATTNVNYNWNGSGWVGSTSTTAAPVTTGATGAMSSMDALQMLKSLYSGMGLGPEIADALTGLIKEGFTSSTISLIAQDPTSVSSSDPYIKSFATAYNTRFSANQQRIKNGFSPLSPADYIARENAFKSIMQTAGLPTGFYDTKEALSPWIADNVDTTTLQSKVNMASDILTNADQTVKDQAQYLYGLDQSHLLAHILDPEAALPLIQKQVNTIQLGAEASRQGLTQNLETLNQLNALGITQAQATAGFRNIAEQLPATQALATRYAGYVEPGTAESALMSQQFGTNAAAGDTPAAVAEKLKRLQTQEVSTFGGSAGADTRAQSLGIGTAQGIS